MLSDYLSRVTEENTNNLRQDSRCPGWRSNQTAPDYRSEALSPEPPCSTKPGKVVCHTDWEPYLRSLNWYTNEPSVLIRAKVVCLIVNQSARKVKENLELQSAVTSKLIDMGTKTLRLYHFAIRLCRLIKFHRNPRSSCYGLTWNDDIFLLSSYYVCLRYI